MHRPGFLNDNQLRSYPFIRDTGTDILPNAWIVDFGAIMEIDADFQPQLHQIYLHSVSRLDDIITFRFRTDAPGASNEELVFTHAADADSFQLSQVESSSITATTDSVSPKWSGFLATGRLDAADNILADGESLTSVHAGVYLFVYSASNSANGPIIFAEGLQPTIEPARIQSLQRSYARTITVINRGRTLTATPEGCGNDWPEDVYTAKQQPLHFAGEFTSGIIRLVEGYNCRIRQSPATNAFEINGDVGGGLGEPCEELPLYDGEPALGGSSYLSGGIKCSDIIKTINGVAGPYVRVLGGAGLTVTVDDENPNILHVRRSLEDLGDCTARELETSFISLTLNE